MVDQASGNRHRILNKEQKLLLLLQLAVDVSQVVAMAMIIGSFD